MLNNAIIIIIIYFKKKFCLINIFKFEKKIKKIYYLIISYFYLITYLQIKKLIIKTNYLVNKNNMTKIQILYKKTKFNSEYEIIILKKLFQILNTIIINFISLL